MMTLLDKIVAQKKREVAVLPPLPRKPALAEARRDFIAALQRPRRGAPALIAEVKKASPSAGIICPDFDPVRIAREYESAGAACVSVLTDERFFQGSLSHLRAIRQAVSLPLLRKDFIIDERQIPQSVQYGADAILLIVRILDDAQLRRLLARAAEAGLAALVEVHDEAELDRALAAGGGLIGINNRNLDTFTVDLGATARLAAESRINSSSPRAASAPPPTSAASAAPARAPSWSANPCCAIPAASPPRLPGCLAPDSVLPRGVLRARQRQGRVGHLPGHHRHGGAAGAELGRVQLVHRVPSVW